MLSSWALMLNVGFYAFLWLFFTTLIVNGLRDTLLWDGRVFGVIALIFLAILIYYWWPWFRYDPMQRVPTLDMLNENALLSRLKAAFIGSLIGIGAGEIAWQYFRSNR